MGSPDQNSPQGVNDNPTAPRLAPQRRVAYWRANLTLIFILLSIWAAVSYGCGIFLIDWLNQFTIGRLPLGFWFAQQGSIYVFVVLIFVYALVMDRLDRRFGVKE